jgi:CubicO group peptidase (beta-lactamase class C family)
VIGLLLLGAAGWAQEVFDWKPLTTAIEAAMRRTGVVGLSIAVVNDQQVIFSRGFGYADLAQKLPATSTTVYAAGGLAQPLTAVGALALANQGKLAFDATLPGLTLKSRFPNADPVTPRNILAHHSGLPAYRFKGLWANPPTPFTDYPALLGNDYLTAPPNTVYTYSEVGYGLLGVAMQRAAGKAFADYMDAALFTPLKMHRTGYSAPARGMAKAYRGTRVDTEPPAGNLPAAGLYSTTDDLAQFIKFLFTDGKVGGRALLSPAQMAEMLRPQYTNLPLDGDTRMGLGWEIGTVRPMIPYAGPATIALGDTFLMHGRMLLLPQEQLGVVVLTNSESGGGTAYDVAVEGLRAALEAKTHRLWYKAPDPIPAALPALSDEAITNYLGAYSLQGALLKVDRKGSRLTTQIAGHTLEMAPLGNGRYTVRARVLGLFTFSVAALRDTSLSFATLGGKRVIVSERAGRRSIAAVKLPTPAISERWHKRVGTYVCTNPDAGSPVPVTEARLALESGLLVVIIRAPQGELRVPLLPENDTEALTAGLGRGLGETVHISTRNGEEYLAWSGFVFKKK